MSASDDQTLVTVTIPVTFEMTVKVPAGVNARAMAETVAAHAAERFAHVSHLQIHAFNEVNRIHPQGSGSIEAVDSRVATIAARKTAA